MMNSAHRLLEQLQREGASRFSATDLGRDHAHVARAVRRQRAARNTVFSVASVAALGAVAFGASQYGTPTVSPAITPTTTGGGPSPSPSASPAIVTVSIAKQLPIEKVARELAMAFDVREDEALEAITTFLPDEAGGYGEGWVLAGEYTFDPEEGLASAAKQLASTATVKLDALGVPRGEWAKTVTLASIIQQEAPAAHADQSAVARVLLNRIDQGMMLQVESPLRYYLRAEEPVGDDGWAVDTPYNTYMYAGLPPSAVGAFTPEALEAAANPADADWLYFLRKPDGNVLLFTTYDEFAVAVDELNPGTGASG